MDIGFLRGTKGRILRLLRAGERTAEELAAPLDVSPNAVRSHLTELERDGLVQQRAVRRGPRKPSFGFSLTQRADAFFPQPYTDLLNAVVDDTRTREGDEAVRALFQRLGERMAAAHASRYAGQPPAERLAAALRAMGEMGAVAEVVDDPTHPGERVLRGQSCPLKGMVPDHAEACVLVESYLQGVLPGARVREVCDRSGPPRCCFELGAYGAAGA